MLATPPLSWIYPPPLLRRWGPSIRSVEVVVAAFPFPPAPPCRPRPRRHHPPVPPSHDAPNPPRKCGYRGGCTLGWRTACLALGQGATVEVELMLNGSPVEPNHHPGLPVPEDGGGHGLEPVAEGVRVIVDGPEDTDYMEVAEVAEDKKEVTLIIL